MTSWRVLVMTLGLAACGTSHDVADAASDGGVQPADAAAPRDTEPRDVALVDASAADAGTDAAVVVVDAGADAGPLFIPPPLTWQTGPGVHHADPSVVLSNECLRTTYGGAGYDGFRDVRPLAGGGLLAAGTTTATTSSYLRGWLARIEADGAVAWSWSIGGDYRSGLHSVIATRDGGLVAAGFDQVRGPGISFDSYAALVVRTSSDGTMQWSRQLLPPAGFAWAVSVIELDSGELRVVGLASAGGTSDGWIARLGADGTALGERFYELGGEDELCAAGAATDGGLVVAGRSFAGGSSLDELFVMRLDAAGDEVWRRSLGTTHTQRSAAERPCGVDVLDGGGVAIAATDAEMPFAQSTRLVVLDPAGAVVRDQLYGIADDYRGAALTHAADGELVLVGPDIRAASGLDFRATRVANDSSVRWDTRFGGSVWDYPRVIRPASAVGFVVGGDTESVPEVATQAWIVALSESGVFGCL